MNDTKSPAPDPRRGFKVGDRVRIGSRVIGNGGIEGMIGTVTRIVDSEDGNISVARIVAQITESVDCQEGYAPDGDVLITKALEIAKDGGIDGAHHKAWVIDQMVRALTGCPMVTRTAKDANGATYEYEAQGESAEYTAWVAGFRDGDDGPNTYEWDCGIAP